MNFEEFNKIFIMLCFLIIFFVLGMGVGVRMSEAHEIPYPSSSWEAKIYLQIKAQQAAIDKLSLIHI